MSEGGIQFIADHERFRSNAYPDIAGKQTIGYGHRIFSGEDIQGPLTLEQGMDLLHSDVSSRVQPGLDMITADLNQNQVDAVGSLIFNVGVAKFGTSKSLKAFNQGNFTLAKKEMKEFRKAGGRVVPGLVNRRADERRLFDTPSKDGDGGGE